MKKKKWRILQTSVTTRQKFDPEQVMTILLEEDDTAELVVFQRDFLRIRMPFLLIPQL